MESDTGLQLVKAVAILLARGFRHEVLDREGIGEGGQGALHIDEVLGESC